LKYPLLFSLLRFLCGQCRSLKRALSWCALGPNLTHFLARPSGYAFLLRRDVSI
jgi:hypothetical protein